MTAKRAVTFIFWVSMKKQDFSIVTCSDKTKIALETAKILKKSLFYPHIDVFADGEMAISFDSLEAVKKVFFIESILQPIETNLLKILLCINELQLNGVEEIYGIFPYLGYMRQDRTAMRLMAKLLEASGLRGIGLIEIHSPRIISHFSIPFYHMSIAPLIASHIKKNTNLENVSIVAPDKGGFKRAQQVATLLDCPLISVYKKRIGINQPLILGFDGQCKGRHVIIIDDIIDTARTATYICQELLLQGACKVWGYFAHPVLSDGGLERVESSAFEKVFVSDTIPFESKRSSVVEIFGCGELILDFIKIMQ